jgi:hypothetical protein
MNATKLLLATAALTSATLAQTEVLVTSNIATSTTWTANNRYNLQQQIYVLPGATLTIEAGTIIASDTGLGGSLAVTRGAQIFVNGTEKAPVIFTSKADVATWTNNDPKTGTWRAAANEWGNLTIMGSAYISENLNPNTNTATPNANNVGTMEGLVAGFPGDTKVLYGGGNDNDDSGTLSYVSFRYGGRVIGLNNELNGLSLGGIGRGTDIHHVEIMNNVDDGIEIWGGTVNLKNISIWNIGDDSFDVDQGWRGKAQYGLIVQGYSVPGSQGSGWGDNAIEIDGAEQSDYQPVTTAALYNFTVIGAPTTPVTGGAGGSDHGVAFRDNARLQVRNSIFLDIGEQVIRNDNVDGDGGLGYGHNGTLSFAALWTTPYNTYSTVNAPANPAAFYTAQTSGNLIEFTDNVFYRNQHAQAYTTANANNVFAAGNNNVQATSMPIQSLGRAAAVIVSGSNTVANVNSLDPRPAADALVSANYAVDSFFDAARYRGAFAPTTNWTLGWTAADAYGFMVRGDNWTDLGTSARGGSGAPVLQVAGTAAAGQPTTFSIANGPAISFNAFCFGFARADFNLGGIGIPAVTLVPNINTFGYVGTLSGSQNLTFPNGFSGIPVYAQALVFDNAAPGGIAATNAVTKILP